MPWCLVSLNTRLSLALRTAVDTVKPVEPQRLINGSTISEPESPSVPAKLRGFNFWVSLEQPVAEVDRAVTSLFPETNLARLVMVHWQDAHHRNGTDCYSADAAATVPFLNDGCRSKSTFATNNLLKNADGVPQPPPLGVPLHYSLGAAQPASSCYLC